MLRANQPTNFGVYTNNKIQDEESIDLRSFGTGWGIFSEATTEQRVYSLWDIAGCSGILISEFGIFGDSPASTARIGCAE
jgi:hypothetical protein